MKQFFTLVGLLALSLSAVAQVQRSPRADVINAEYGNNAVPLTANYTMPYAIGENRYMLIVFMGEFNGPNLSYPTAITYGGVPATQLATSVGVTDRVATVVFSIQGNALDAAGIAAGSSNPMNITWNSRNNGSYLLSTGTFRYVSQVAGISSSVLVETGNSATVLTGSPTAVNAGDLAFHFSQFSRGNNSVTISSAPGPNTQPVATNTYFGAPYLNALMPTGASSQFVATTWSGIVPVGTTTYTPTFTRTTNENPARWVASASIIPYTAVYQTVSGRVFYDPNGNKLKDPSETFATTHYVIAVSTNGPNAGKVAQVSPVAADGSYSLTVQANQVEEPPTTGTYVNPTFEINIVASAPAIGDSYSSPAQGELGAPAGFNGYVVTNPVTAGGVFSEIGRKTITATAPFTAIVNQDAGLQSPPTTDVVTTALPAQNVGTFWQLDNDDQQLSGVDSEDGVLETGLNKTFRILSNPTPSGSLVVKVAYDFDGNGPNAPVVLDASSDPDDNIFVDIPNYDRYNLYMYYESGTGSYNGSFSFSALDAAGAPSPTNALYSFTAILPINGLELSGSYSNAKGNLRWTTLTVEDVDHFVIERSNSTNGFKQLMVTPVRGKEYNYIDNLHAFAGNDAYYRVQMVRKNGTVSYSNIISLKLAAVTGLQLSPTAVRSDLQVRFNNPKQQVVNIRVINMAGQAVINNKSQASAGNISINVSGFERLAAGTYSVQVITGNTVQQGKVIVQR